MQILIPIPFPRINILGKCLIPPVPILYTLLPPAPRSRTFRFWGSRPRHGGGARVLWMVRWVGCYPIKMVRVGFEVVLGCSQSAHRTSTRNGSHNWESKFELSGLGPPRVWTWPPPCLGCSWSGFVFWLGGLPGDRWCAKNISITVFDYPTSLTAREIVPKIGFGSGPHCSTDLTRLLPQRVLPMID